MADARLHCKNLHEYLKTLSAVTLDKLYDHPAICLAVFRELPVLSRHYVMRCLFIDQPITQVVVTSWIDPAYCKEHLQASQTLSELRVWQAVTMLGGLPGWQLSETFRKNLKTTLLGGGNSWSICIPLEADKHAKDLNFLDTYAMERWESILHYMVGSQTTEGISMDTVRVLLHAELMKNEEGETNPIITTNGFQFLLMDSRSQVWYFMLQYLDTVESRNMNLVDCLSFLFQLSFSSLGTDYSTDGVSETLLVFLQHLREVGLVFQRKRRSGRFYPTRLAINLASGLEGIDSNVHQEGYIVVETNYRVYAYTDSNLQVALLGLFTELVYRFPNLCVGIITRESIRQALRSGITADQIIGFLRMHSHQEMLKMKPVIPATITDQVRLWELERNRFRFSEGVLYSQFLSQNDFECLRDYAQDLSVLIWENPGNRVMIVSRSGHDEVKRFWKRQKHN